MSIGRNQAVLAVLAEHPDDRPPSHLSKDIGRLADARLAAAVIADLWDRFGGTESAASLLWCVPDPQRFAGVAAGTCAQAPASPPAPRYLAAAKAAFDRGYSHAAIMGLDAPHVSDDTILSALGQTAQYDVVIGTGDRGLFYLVAVNGPFDVYSGVRFDTENATTDLFVEAAAAGKRCAPLVGNFCIRTADDLRRAAEYFARHKTVASPRAAAVIREILAARDAARAGSTS